MKKIQAPQVAVIKLQFGELQIYSELQMVSKKSIYLGLIVQFYHTN